MTFLVGAIICLIVAGIAVPASATSVDLQWAEPVSSTMHIGDSINVGYYSVEASQFHKPMLGVRNINGSIVPRDDFEPGVMLELYKNGTLVNEFTLTQYDSSFITDDEEVMVSLDEIMPEHNKKWVYEYFDPWAVIDVQLRGLPGLNISIDTDENTYTSHRDKKILLNIKVSNEGDGDASNVSVNVYPDSLDLYNGNNEELKLHYTELKVDDEETSKLELEVPENILEIQKYILTVTVSGYDRKEIYYENFEYKVIAIVPPDDFILSKYIRDRIYLSETAEVILKITNSGVFDVTNISVHDTIPVDFILISDSSLDWDIPRLNAGEEIVVGSYEIKPLETDRDGFLLPSSVAYYTINDRQFFVESDAPKVIVNGPKIIVEKNVRGDTNAGSDIEVTTVVYNIGNAPTKISLTDQIPPEAILISGDTSLPLKYLDPDDFLTLSYVISIYSEGNYTLPPAEAEYYDISNVRDNILKEAYSKPVNITVGEISSFEPTSTAFPSFMARTPVATITGKEEGRNIPGFRAELFIPIMFIVCFILRMKGRNS